MPQMTLEEMQLHLSVIKVHLEAVEATLLAHIETDEEYEHSYALRDEMRKQGNQAGEYSAFGDLVLSMAEGLENQ